MAIICSRIVVIILSLERRLVLKMVILRNRFYLIKVRFLQYRHIVLHILWILLSVMDLTKGLVYTNNPWDIAGTQTFEEFLNRFAGMPSDMKMRLLYVSVVIQE